ncbi:hypothetical protein [Aeromonas sp. FDAARGOS 1402]|uniref:hypothetical protein n=1 Tax=Aeromonas sp. FDAARGOS 1402 TaxID=2778051 RepID=UPI001C23A01E|nr:hypothetical protein [Aeromonas sp. FDAARGOS 1402]QWZ53594.1 hypothetical protein I6L32_17485 [Aeromonas sp. FDAARGOS 1402]
MRTYQEVIRAISVRWLIKNALRMVIYFLNPFRLIKWFIYIALGAVFLGVLTLVVGNYVHAAEWVPAKTTMLYSCDIPSYSVSLSGQSNQLACPQAAVSALAQKYNCKPAAEVIYIFYMSTGNQETWQVKAKYPAQCTNYVALTFVQYKNSGYVCPPDGNPDFTMGPIVNNHGTVCEKKPIQCLIGSVKETNIITGKEFCRPICEGIAGNTLQNVSYFQSNFGSVQIQCYGQCSIQPSGVSVSSGQTPNIYTGDIKFTGQNCPVQTNGQTDTVDQAGEIQPPTSSDATNAAQNQLQNAASNATSSQVAGAQGTADLNQVVDKLAETHNKSEKSKAEQNAALGKVIQNTGKDIQASIKEAQLSASQGSAGASLGQAQTANAIKDGNAQLGTKLDAIKDAIEAGNGEEGEEEPDPTLPPGDTQISVDPNDVNPHPNDWSTRNYGTVMQHHVAAMNELPLFTSMGQFFQINMSGGSCPTFSLSLPEIGGVGGNTLLFDVFCSEEFRQLFVIIALCVKLLGLAAGFRIAFLD